MTMKRKIFRIFLIFVGIFFCFFAFRLAYGYLYPYGDNFPLGARDEATSSISYGTLQKTKNNYATSQFDQAVVRRAPTAPTAPNAAAIQQKYEKTSFINSSSKDFESDVKKVYAAISDLKGMVQSEQNRGVTGQRWLGLVIGVTPENFDAMNQQLQGIAKLEKTYIEKVDKTNEFLSLQAKRTSLEATRKALLEFKTRDGKIPELIELQKEILEIESKIQELGVQLSDFDENQSFCTVQYTITERAVKDVSISIFTRIKVALEWTLIYYGLFVSGLFAALLCASLLVLVGAKLKSLLLSFTDDRPNW